MASCLFVLAGALAVTPQASAATTETFAYTGAVQTWTVPAGITSATFELQGAEGGSGSEGGGGKGGTATATIAVTPGSMVSIYVGGAGGHPGGGFNGGGAGFSGAGYNGGGAGGGGATDIRIGGIALTDRVLVAGAGGGGGGCHGFGTPPVPGGDGGGATGGDGAHDSNCEDFLTTRVGTGGTQSAGGTNAADPGRNGSLGSGGSGAATGVSADYDTAGGGGGYYGGAGGYNMGAGGGGSGYGPSGTTTFQTGVRSGNGVASVTYGAPSITSADHTTSTVGSAGSFTITTSPGSPSATTLNATGSLPSGVGFTDNGNGTATLAGTPAAGTGGSYPLTITASNGVNPDATQSFTLTVNEPPSITSANHATFTVASLGSFTLTTNAGHPTATTLAKAGALPSGVTFTDNGNGTATLAGTPAAGTGGSYPLTITASNGVNPDATQSFTVTTREAPTVTTNPSPLTASVGDTATFTAAASGFPAPTVHWQRSTNGGASFTDIVGATNASYSFSVAAGQSGDRYRAVFSNAVSSVTSTAATLTLTARTLTVATAGSGSGTIIGTGIDCGAGGHTDCTETVPDGSTITLTASPGSDSDFAGFSGDGCSGSDATCTVTMTAARSVTATFTPRRQSPSAPDTLITRVPTNPKRAHTHFQFRSSIPGSTFACTLDDEPPEPCRSPKHYRNLKRGRHVFSVVAAAPDGSTDPTPAVVRFRVRDRSAS